MLKFPFGGKKMKKIVMTLLVLVLVGCSSSKPTTETTPDSTEVTNIEETAIPTPEATKEPAEVVAEDFSHLFAFEKIQAVDGDHYIVIENLSGRSDLNVSWEIDYLDADGEVIKTMLGKITGMSSEYKYIEQIYSLHGDEKDRFVDYDIRFKAENLYFDEVIIPHFDSVEILKEEHFERNMDVYVKNNSGDELMTLEVAVVFYLNDQVVDVVTRKKSGYEAGMEEALTIYYPFEGVSNPEYLEYDRYEVYIREAFARP